MKHPTLPYPHYSGTPPHQVHSETSLEAAEDVRSRVNRLQRQVLDFLRSRGDHGATDDEMQRALGLNPSTQRPRRIELTQKGLVEDTTIKRPTRSGRRAVVWRAT